MNIFKYPKEIVWELDIKASLFNAVIEIRDFMGRKTSLNLWQSIACVNRFE